MDDKQVITEISILIKRAADTTAEGISISSMNTDDQSLIYVNSGFERLTGYSSEDVIGRNCRFLQGEGTDQATVDIIRRAIQNGEGCTVELLNYKKDGSPFWNRLSITPLKNDKGEVAHYVGVQSDITELRETKKRLLKANVALQSFKDKIQMELEQAELVQNFILPTHLPNNKKVRFSSFFKPMDEIGGDFYDVIELGKDNYGILCADVTGHGIPAALLTFMTSYAFKNSAFGKSSTSEVISVTNRKLYQKMPLGAFVTMFYAIFNTTDNQLTYTQAGHPSGLLIRPSSKLLIPLKSEGMLVGAVDSEKDHYGEMKIILEKGDKVIMYSDAITELRSGNEMVKQEELYNLIRKHCNLPLPDLYHFMYEFGLTYTGKEKLDDDFTVVGFEVIG